jgi:GxxExxY protein
VTQQIIGAAIAVHRALGPGLLESTYATCLAHELGVRGLRVQRQLVLPLVYKGVHVDRAYRIDLLVEDEVIVELKALTQDLPIHEAQLLSYLRLSGRPVGLLINFHVRQLVQGIRRVVNKFPEVLSAPSAPSAASALNLSDHQGPR